MVRRADAVATAVGLAAGIGGVASAATLHVPSEYASIQAAVDAAASGDSVLVAPGTYASATTRAVFIGGVGAITVTSAIILKDGVSVTGPSENYAFRENVFSASEGFPAVGIRSGTTLVENSCNVYWQNTVGNTSGFSMDATDREVDPAVLQRVAG